MIPLPSVAPSDRLSWTGRLVDLATETHDTQRKPLPILPTVTGAVGTFLIASVGVAAAAVVEPVQLHIGTIFSWLGQAQGRPVAVAIVYLGIALTVWSWTLLGQDVRAGTVDQRSMLIVIGVWVLPLLFAPPLFSRDMFSYLAQGDLALHGLNPYTHGVYSHGVSVLGDHLSADVDPSWRTTPAPYGPLFILLAKLIVLGTGQNTVVGVIAMRITMSVGLVLLCWALPRLAQRLGGSAPGALWLGVANPFVLTYLVGSGHNDLLMTGLMAAGTVLVLDRRYRRGFILVTLAFAVKATAVVLLPFLVWIWAATLTGPPVRRFAKAAAGGLAIVVVTFALCTLAAGVDLGWIPALRTSTTVVNYLSVPTGVGQFAHRVATLVHGHGSLAGYLAGARDLGLVAMVVLVVRQWWLARDGQPVTTIQRAAVALLIVAVLSPVTLPWYFSWTLVIAAGLAWTRRGFEFGVLGSVWLTLVTFPDGTSALYDWVYLAAATVAAVLAAMALVSPDPLRVSSLGLRALTADTRHRIAKSQSPGFGDGHPRLTA